MTRVLLLCVLLAPYAARAQDEGLPPEPPSSEPPAVEEPPPARPGAADPRALFERRALTLSVRRSTIEVMRGGRKIRDEELRLLTSSNRAMDKRWEEIDAGERRTDAIMGMGLGACLAAPACGGILGAVASVIALQGYAWGRVQELDLSPVNNALTFMSGALAGVCAGCLVGGVILPAALGVKIVADSLSDDELHPEEYARLVTQYNLALARNLGLNPASLDPIYFPAS